MMDCIHQMLWRTFLFFIFAKDGSKLNQNLRVHEMLLIFLLRTNIHA